VLADKDGRQPDGRVYGVDAGPNEEKYHIFVLTKPLAERAADLKMNKEELPAKLPPAEAVRARAKANAPARHQGADVERRRSPAALLPVRCSRSRSTPPPRRRRQTRADQTPDEGGRLLRTYGRCSRAEGRGEAQRLPRRLCVFRPRPPNCTTTGEAKWPMRRSG
jgi:hypothetical protein